MDTEVETLLEMLRSLPQNKKTLLSKALKLDGGRDRKAAKAKVVDAGAAIDLSSADSTLGLWRMLLWHKLLCHRHL